MTCPIHPSGECACDYKTAFYKTEPTPKEEFKGLEELVDDTTHVVSVPTLFGWKCEKDGCKIDWFHKHTTYSFVQHTVDYLNPHEFFSWISPALEKYGFTTTTTPSRDGNGFAIVVEKDGIMRRTFIELRTCRCVRDLLDEAGVNPEV